MLWAVTQIEGVIECLAFKILDQNAASLGKGILTLKSLNLHVLLDASILFSLIFPRKFSEAPRLPVALGGREKLTQFLSTMLASL